MVIVQIAGMSSSKYGGLERFFVRSAEIAKQKSNRYVVVYESRPLSQQFLTDMNLAGGEIVVMPSRHGSSVSFILKIIKFFVHNKVDVVHAHFNPAGDLSLLAGFLIGIRKRYKTIHSTMQNQATGEELTSIKEVSYKTILVNKLSAYLSTEIFCASNAIKNQYNSLLAANPKRQTLYLGTNLKKIESSKIELRQEFGLAQEKIYLINISRHIPLKRIDTCLKVLACITKRYNNVALIQIGGEPLTQEYENYLLNLTDKLDLTNNVIWLGLTDRVSEFLKAADIFVHLPAGEGLGLVAAEAFAQHLPVVASNVGGLQEIIIDGKNGYIVDVDDVFTAAEHITNLIENIGERQTFADHGFDHIKKIFDLTNQAKKYLNIYAA